jgi:hypothetical protein
MRSPAAVSIAAWPAAINVLAVVWSKLYGSAQARGEILESSDFENFLVSRNDVGGCKLEARIDRPIVAAPTVGAYATR